MSGTQKKGRIIAIVGAPRSGKSFLATKLAEHYKARLFLEGEEGTFPKRIEEDITQNIRPLERVLWFRTMLVNRYLEAMRLRDEGYTVVLDVFWMSPQLFIDALLSGFEQELMHDVAAQDRRLLGWPDATIFLKISETSMRDFIAHGGRSFDQSEAFVTEQAMPVNRLHEEFFARESANTVLVVERDGLDFDRDDHLEGLTAQIDALFG
ncbi:MAG: hypothetical protein PHV99_00110 [Candidatus Pacebacteria bacterium]|nr:hypothetical protein [Candidatus Paceibacterota bacterium]